MYFVFRLLQNVNDLDIAMRKLIDTEQVLLAHEKALQELREALAKKEEIVSSHSVIMLSTIVEHNSSNFFSVCAVMLQEDIIEKYDSLVEQKMSDYKKKTTRKKYGKHESYSAFRQAIHVRFTLAWFLNRLCLPPNALDEKQEVQHPDNAMPPVTELLPKGKTCMILHNINVA